ncbi:MAG: 1-(5-phosphoribosyl)-5-[(5-phosphoribosylamino)methylideneamino] imidazole-4-carboxamide isomerase [Synergistaceae bacterium]|jgi:phosphoribosylformimino-5-aminoimidazole carboxamide ribotide isomerase|nr:1-(5-phosphoribosyl)-5-[(5-phosphoribosylamino)methylideneamino] imidazole-4-carboxamide isomerase [Synergistaceae bacterium]
MIIFPAIDLYAGRVVRLRKGDFSDRTDYGADPLAVARAFAEAGCRHLHVVDLEGAESGSPKHLRQLRELSGLGMEIEYGGGLRTEADIRDALSAGASRAMAGSIVFDGGRGMGRARSLFSEFGEAITPSIDVAGGKVVVSGWTEATGESPGPCLGLLRSIGYTTFLVTATDRDGMLQGPDVSLYGDLLRCVADARIIAAGGVTDQGDIKRLRDAGLYGAVVGKALYERGFDLAEAMAASGGEG